MKRGHQAWLHTNIFSGKAHEGNLCNGGDSARQSTTGFTHCSVFKNLPLSLDVTYTEVGFQ